MAMDEPYIIGLKRRVHVIGYIVSLDFIVLIISI